jgi:trimethylamine monooxygenase
MFDAQAWFARDVIMGKRVLPDAAAQHADWSVWRAKDEVAETAAQQIDFQVRGSLCGMRK